MIDELDLLKKDWQKREEHLPKLSFDQIHNMIWKKSSSIVRWILIISILEITLPNLIYLSPSFRENPLLRDAGGFNTIYIVLNVFYYAVVLYFIFQFYRRYKEISILDSAKNLMRQIIKTRKTVKHYIIFCLTMSLVFFALFIVGIYLSDDVLLAFDGIAEKSKEIPLEKIRTTTIWILSIGAVVFTAFIAGIYFLLYGLLLRKLKRNYKELKQLEV
ncbi:hypothetical protein HPE56_14185 [Maribacter sp. ANRC-HE7]|uniref:DUF4013 domain-containing protein n=1 Tax=Maribacter aquimaris TaxID=2737171 RepID=A0ABR7V3M1_9FLAO|nr:hypothetical protein [Maribacter aquimaris]MBD0778945.1 hypothetical protein [Maribacter aquimaris]